MNKLLILITLLFLLGCNTPKEERKYIYIKTERGLLSYTSGYCDLGMLLNNDGDNIYDENSKPIACSGYIELTRTEFENYKN